MIASTRSIFWSGKGVNVESNLRRLKNQLQIPERTPTAFHVCLHVVERNAEDLGDARAAVFGVLRDHIQDNELDVELALLLDDEDARRRSQ